MPGLGTAQTNIEERVKFSMAALKAKTERLGAPNIEGTDPTGGRDWPALYFGTTKMNNSTEVVDEVVNQHGGIATLLVRAETSSPNLPRFVRVATTIKKDDGSRAVGTSLAPGPPPFGNLREGKAYYGIAMINGKAYETGYEPIKDASGNVIAVYAVGFLPD
jgi:cache 3/cache 2 fusion protein